MAEKVKLWLLALAVGLFGQEVFLIRFIGIYEVFIEAKEVFIGQSETKRTVSITM